MEYVDENYIRGKQVPRTERGKCNVIYAIDYYLDVLYNLQKDV